MILLVEPEVGMAFLTFDLSSAERRPEGAIVVWTMDGENDGVGWLTTVPPLGWESSSSAQPSAVDVSWGYLIK